MHRTILPAITASYLVAGVIQATAAHATEHETAPVQFTINDTRTVRSDVLSLPLIYSLISGVAEDLGVVTTVSSRAVISYTMQGESTLAWPVADAESAVYHRITPRSHASVIDVNTELDLQVAVQGRVFGSFFAFTIVGQNVYFADEIRSFTPFMLPFQPDSTHIQRLEPRSTNGSLRFPLTIPVPSPGVVNLSTGATFRADPMSRVEVRGESLTSRVEQGPSTEDVFSTTGADLTAGGFFQHPVVLDGKVPEVHVAHEWESEIATALGYMLGVDLVFQVEIFGFPHSFNFNLWEQQFDLLPLLPASTATSAAPVSLPLPVAEVSPASWASAGTRTGTTLWGSVTVENVGAMALAGDALVLGTTPFTVTPTSFVVPPGSTRTLQVSFTPVAIGGASSTLRIVTNDPAAPEIDVALLGEGLAPSCGDGIIDASEACDDGASNSDTTADACRSDCTLPACGDGVVDAGEACDDGADNSSALPGACRDACQPPRCGDGVVDPGEACDPGPGSRSDAAMTCTSTCANVASPPADNGAAGRAASCAGGCATGRRGDAAGLGLFMLLAVRRRRTPRPQP